MGRAIVSGLFVVLVMMSIVVLGLSFLSPLENKKKVPKYSATEVGTSTPVQEPIKPSFNPLSIFGFGNNEPNEETPVPTPIPEETPAPVIPTKPSLSLTSIGTSPAVDGKVLQLNYDPVSLAVDPGSSQAPLSSRPITPEEYLPNSNIIKFSDQGVEPASFSVTAGLVVNLVVRSEGESSHVFRFRDKSLKAVAVGVGPEESRAISFNAPGPGTYEFFCDVPGHKTREVGTMIVN